LNYQGELLKFFCISKQSKLGPGIGLVLVVTVSLPSPLRAKNPNPPKGWENRTGSVEYLGVGGMDTIVTPDLAGRVSDPVAIHKFLKGSGFYMIIKRFEASLTVAEGIIISQTPRALQEVKSRGPIHVVISTGSDKECAEILNSDENLRSAFQKAGNDIHSICTNLRKLKSRTSK
jgi:hypothetical protein